MRVDAHHHFWNLEQVEYSWLTPQAGILYRTYEAPELEPQVKAAGIERTVLVQAADSLADTDYMLRQAERYPWIGAVVGWVPLREPEQARAALERYTRHPKFRGIRHLIHNEPDADWVMQGGVLEGLRLLAEFRLVFELPASYRLHLKHVLTLAEKLPDLTLVIDHLAGPPIREGTMEGWAEVMAAVAKFPNVHAKVSGLATVADPKHWSAADLRPYIHYAVGQFGAGRLMAGSDHPVCLLAGNYARIWRETEKALEGLTPDEKESILGGTASRIYRL